MSALAATQSQLLVLVDKQELQELVLRYARLIDRKDFARLAHLYHPDGHHDHGSMFAGGPKQFIAWLQRSMGDIETQHLVANSLFMVEGDTAKGEIYTVNFHHLPASESNYIAGGRYLDRYVRHEEHWVFQSRTRVVDWSEERPANSGATASGLLRGKAWREDPANALAPFYEN